MLRGWLRFEPLEMKIAVHSRAGTLEFECGGDETILEAGLRQGLTLPYECATGSCGTCRARVMAGEATMAWQGAPGLAKLRLDKGDILMCQARGRRDCLIRVPADVTASAATAEKLPDRRRGLVRNVRRLTRDVIDFEVVLSRPMTFEAGQFVVVEAPDIEGGRAYSMVNFQADADRIALLVKRKPGGGFGDWLFEHGPADAELRVFGPLGRATFRIEEDRNMLCIAGGAGIAGMMSMLERATSAQYFRKHKGYVFFGVRTMADAFYLRELSSHVHAAEGRLEVTLALSDERAPATSHPQFPELQVATGLVHETAAQMMMGRYDNVIAYAAGPPPMVDGALRMLLREAGLSAQRIRYDKFT